MRGRSREIRPHRQEGGMRGGGRFHRRRIVASSARAIERRRRRSRTTSAAFGGDDEKAKGGGGSARSHRSGGPPATSRGRLRGDVPDQRSAREQCRIYRSNRGRGFMAHNITRSLIDSTIYRGPIRPLEEHARALLDKWIRDAETCSIAPESRVWGKDAFLSSSNISASTTNVRFVAAVAFPDDYDDPVVAMISGILHIALRSVITF